jgi:prepilin-type N-terminal cleavage/methylation domain-containing protein
MKKSTMKSGFTLIELLVSLSLFVIFLGVVSSSYISVVRSQRQANTVRKMYSHVRTFMDTLNQEVRLGTIDYDCYEKVYNEKTDVNKCPPEVASDIAISADGFSSYLAIVNKDQTEKTIYKYDHENKTIKVKKFIQSGGGWSPSPEFDTAIIESSDGFKNLFPNELQVTGATFALYPAVNPYSKAHYKENQYQFQPKVTLFLTVANAGQSLPPFHLNLQTSISSRVYTRQ